MRTFENYLSSENILKEEVSNDSVIDAFISGDRKIRSQHLYINRNSNGTRTLVNYSTPIAYLSKDGVMYVNSRRYSVTTSKIQNRLRAALSNAKFDTAEVDENALKDKIDEDEQAATSDRIESEKADKPTFAGLADEK